MRPNPSTAESLAAMTELSAAITQQMAQLTGEASQPSQEAGVVSYEKPQVHGPRVVVSPTSGMVATAAQGQQHVDDLVRRHTAKTARSKQLAQRYRGVLADSRARVGFRHSTKEMHYPIAGARGHGSRLEDVDGNSYVDITMGFGILLFGHEPEFVTEAARAHLASGIRLGPRGPETGEAAELLSELTGMQRVAFANSGTEANSAAIRLARAATGRAKIVMFHGSYHGHADNVLGRSIGVGAERETVPVSTGIPSSAVTDLIVLDYGAPESLRVIEELADEIAAVLVEPVQSRNPSLRPVEFVRSLREITRQRGIVLLFDEMLTGFRPHLRGAQELYGVSPDLATYGKLLGGGYPIGAIAGRADIMDGVDGGFWRYGDDSYP
ncbi:MAG: aminotransferase class III-fold pyridoxal phosphate-dependent enzyme, partial [Micromonosporaceae bacterium]